MKFKEIVKRITGISTPVFGVSWNPEATDRDQARTVLAFLEDRRVLYNPSELEMPRHCVESVLQMRQLLTEKIGAVQHAELHASLKAMRAACRKFLDTVGNRNDLIVHAHHSGHWASWEFNSAIGELRGVCGVHIAKIAAMFGLDVEEPLSTILPGEDRSERSPRPRRSSR